MPHQAIDRQNHCTHIASGHILSTLPSYNSGHCYCVEQKQLAVLLLRTFIAQSKSSVTPVAVIRPTSVMPPRKRLLLSAYCERVANALARGGDAVPEDELKNAAAEAATLLALQMHLRDTNEWRMCLALLAATTEAAAPPPCPAVTDSGDEVTTPPAPQPLQAHLEVLHAASPAAVAAQAGAVLKETFGEHYGDEIDDVLQGNACANQENDRTFVVAWRAAGVVQAAGIVAERRVFVGKNAPRKIVWEVLWLCAQTAARGRGHGTRAWAALARVAAWRGVAGVLVPSTDAALLFWLGAASAHCPLGVTLLREDGAAGWAARSTQFQKRGTVDRVRRAVAGLAVAARPGAGLAGLYEATAAAPVASGGGRLRRRRSRPSLVAAAAACEGRPYRWNPSEATHLWFFPGVAKPPVRVVKAVAVRDARPRAASFIREDISDGRPRASSTCGVRGFAAEGG